MLELSYESEFSYSEEKKPLIIQGTALNAGLIPSKKLVIPPEELENLAKTLREGMDGKGAYLLVDHEKTVDKLIGRVIDAWVVDNKRVDFEATVFDDAYAEKIKNGLVSYVSTGLQLEREECSICGKDYLTGGCNHRLGHEYNGKTCYIIGRGLRGREISLVLFPADPGASLTVSLSRELEKIEKMKEESLSSEELNKDDFERNSEEEKEGENEMVKIVELTQEEVAQHPFVIDLMNKHAALQEKVQKLEEEKKEMEKKIKELTAELDAYKEAEAKRKKEIHDALVHELLEKRKEAGLPEKKPEDFENFSDEAIKEMIAMVESIKVNRGAKGKVELSEDKSREELKKEIRKKLGWE